MPTTYCTQSDVEAILSAAGVTAFADDDEDGSLDGTETGYITRAIERAAARMNAVLEIRYKLADLTSNAWCQFANADVAAYLLTSRRGNSPPTQIADAYQEVIDLLDKIKANRGKVPEQGESFDFLPSVSNYQPVRGVRNMPVRVDPNESTGDAPATGIKRETSQDYPY
jgi:phage gp36-like protein